jgi:LuxR family maltose regulon positive regulatory protein
MARACSASAATPHTVSLSFLLATKFYVPPPRPHRVSRPHLLERLSQGLACRLILVSSPAGFGKTTLLSEWVASLGSPLPGSPTHKAPQVAWLSLDANDNDPTRFVSYAVAALQGVLPQVGQTVQAVSRSAHPPSAETVLAILVNELCSVPDHLVLVLDDYHAIDTAAVHQAMTFLLDHMPPCLHVIIATRVDPPLPLARWRSRGELLEIRADDLRFTAEEAALFLNQAMGLNLSAQDVAALEARTEGWIVGLEMAALSLQKSTDPAAFIQAFSGSHHFVLDYLVEEVLNHQSADVQAFLLRTSILERLSGPLCDAVTGQGESQAMLERLEKANLFLVPLDDERCWYRYHPLFRDVLRARLQRQCAAPEMQALHRAASQWFEQHDQVNGAVRQALQGEDFDRVADLVGRYAETMTHRGELITLLHWLDALPESIVRTSPRLSMIAAWTLLAGSQFEAVEPRLQDVERALGLTAERAADDPALPAGLRGAVGEVLCVRANVAFHHADLSRVLALSQQALRCLSDDVNTGLFHAQPELRSVIPFNIALAHEFGGDVGPASEMFAETIARSRPLGNMHLVMLASSHLAQIQRIQGRLHQAAATYRQAMHSAQESAWPLSPMLGRVYVGLGNVLGEWNDLASAESYLRQGMDLARPWSNWETLIAGHLGLARVEAARGDWVRAGRELADLAAGLPALPSPWGMPLVRAHQAQLEARCGDLAAAAAWVQETELAMADDLGYAREPEAIILARVLAALGRLDEAARLFDRLLAAAEAGGRIGHTIQVLVGRSLVLEAQGRHEAASVAVERALVLAKPEGYVRVFADEGAALVPLLRRAAARGVACDDIGKLLAALGDEAAGHRLPWAAAAGAPLVEPLSERELEVLRLMAIGLSNQEMAGQLALAVGTVKAHVHHILGKLAAQNRTLALARARELHLL